MAKGVVCPEPDLGISEYALKRGLSPPAKIKFRAYRDESNIRNSDLKEDRNLSRNNFTKIKGQSNLSYLLNSGRKSRSPSEGVILPTNSN